MLTARFTARSRIAVRWLSAVAACVGLGLTPPVGGQSTQADGTRGASQTVATGANVYSAGAEVRPAAAIEGDFFGVGARVMIDHSIKGDATVAGGSVSIRAAIGDDLRAAGGDLNIESSIGGELLASGGSITLTKAARVKGGAGLYAGTVIMDGHVEGLLTVGAEKVYLNGEVDGDARLRAGQIELGPNAKIKGGLSHSKSAVLKRHDGATIGGAVTADAEQARAKNHDDDSKHAASGGQSNWFGSVFTYLALFVCAAGLLLLIPGYFSRLSGMATDAPWASMGVGLATMLALPPAAVLLAITILGIPLAILVLAAYPALVLLGYLVGVQYLARRLQRALRPALVSSFANQTGYFALALIAMMALGWIPILGTLANICIALMGVGAGVRDLYRRREAGRNPPARRSGDGALTPLNPVGA